MDPNAVSDIIMSDEFAGAVDAVKSITGVIDGGFSFFISVVAFFIISVALLRNVLAGCYVAFPKFWDQVDKAHEQRDENKAFFDTIKGMKDSYKTASLSTVKQAIFGIIPNIKDLTDFKGENIPPKQYFIKAIPEMIAVVIIGVFIYNGYYRDVTAKVSDVGSTLIERTILEFDPVSTYDTLMNTAGKPVFATDNSIDVLGKFQNKLSNAIYYAIVGKYTDITSANNKANMAGDIDKFVTDISAVNGLSDWVSAEDGNKYEVDMAVDIVKDFDVDKYTHLDGDKIKQWCFKASLGPESNNGLATYHIGFDSLVEAVDEGWYLRVTLRGHEKNYTAEQTVSSNTVDATLTIGASGTNVMLDFQTTKWTLGDYKISGTVADKDGNEVEGSANITLSTGDIGTGLNKHVGFKFTSPSNVISGKDYKLDQPLTLEVNGCTIRIKTVTISSSATTASIDGSNDNWTVNTVSGVPKAARKEQPSTQEAPAAE